MLNSNVSSLFDIYYENVFEKLESHLQTGGFLASVFCEYTPCELIHAAGGWAVGMCGGCQDTIPLAEEVLPASLCPLIKSSFGYHLSKKNRFLEHSSLVIGETTCDGKKKMYELMSETRKTHILELPQKNHEASAREHWYLEIVKLKHTLEELTQKEISDASIRAAVHRSNIIRKNNRRLLELHHNRNCTISQHELMRCSVPFSGMLSAEEHTRLIDQVTSLKFPKSPQSQPRILITGVPLTNTRILEWIESEKAKVVVMENCTGIKPFMRLIDENSDTILRAIADYYIDIPCSVLTPNNGRMELLHELIQRFEVDAIIEIIWHGCLTYDVESYHVKNLAETCNLPYLKINSDFSDSNAAQIQTRIAALCEIAKERL